MTDGPTIAILHYHLRPGGVTRVLQQTLTPLAERGFQVALLCGEFPSDETWPVPVIVDPALGYGQDEDPQTLAERLSRAIQDKLGAPPDLWHIHNHSLGKNLSVPRLVMHLADAGQRLLLQVHDFSEDGRPENYAGLRKGLGADMDRLYPGGHAVRYALLNARDARIMERIGAKADLLPNPVSAPEAVAETPTRPSSLPDGPLWLYPTRAIRRKNIGEALLTALTADITVGLTLAPRNPSARPVYEAWVQYAEAQAIPVRFDLGAALGCTYAELIALSDAMVTTSVAEGFGLAFLEPWLSGKPLCGRNLPDITEDFEREGIDLSHLYAQWPVPIELIGTDRLRGSLHQTMKQWMSYYDRTLDPQAFEMYWSSIEHAGVIDFGVLDESQQRTLLDAALHDHTLRAQLKPPTTLPERKIITANAERIRERYSPTVYAERLTALYTRLLNTAPDTPESLPATRLLEVFLSPERFTALRV